MTFRSAAVLLSLLAALSSQGLTPHLHVGDEIGQHLHSQTQDCHEAAARLEADCVTCRSGTKLRATGAAPMVSAAPPNDDSPLRLASRDVPFIVAFLFCVASPPRAPPA